MIIGERFEVVRRFQGGMGQAFLVSDRFSGGKLCVLKTHRDGQHGERYRAALKNEARVWIRLHGQAHLARIDDIIETGGRVYLRMPYYQNGSLADEIARGMDLERVVDCAAQLVIGMCYIGDRQQILHLDLKPSNILVGDDLEMRIADLGLARVPAHRNADGQWDAATNPWPIGTPAYMSPEMIKGHGVDTQADVWAFGLLVYEMVMSEPAFVGDSIEDLCDAIIHHRPHQWRTFADAVPSFISRMVAGCLRKNPDDRLQSFAEVGRALDVGLRLQATESASEDRVELLNDRTVFAWREEFRRSELEFVLTAKSTEIMWLTQAHRLRKLGDARGALAVLEQLLGPTDSWGEQWCKLMRERNPAAIQIDADGNTHHFRLGQVQLRDAARARLAAFLDLMYTGQPVSDEECQGNLLAAEKIVQSGTNEPKLIELCGQLFLRLGYANSAERCFRWVWDHADEHTLSSSGACLATALRNLEDFEELRRFTETELIPKLATLDDAHAQETCARVWIFLREPATALPYLRRSLAISPDNSWGVMQAVIACWNVGAVNEARQWRLALERLGNAENYLAELDRLIPELNKTTSTSN